MKLFAKIMLNFKHYISVSCGVSKDYCGEEQSNLAGTGQGNKFSQDMHRDMSCLIISKIEEQNLGVIFENQKIEQKEESAAVVHVDNADLATNGAEQQEEKKFATNDKPT